MSFETEESHLDLMMSEGVRKRSPIMKQSIFKLFHAVVKFNRFEGFWNYRYSYYFSAHYAYNAA